MSWREWFNEYGLYNVTSGYEVVTSAEEMYQAIKARLIEELAVQTDELLRPAELVEKPANPRPWY